jgi:hypothetical protein
MGQVFQHHGPFLSSESHSPTRVEVKAGDSCVSLNTAGLAFRIRVVKGRCLRVYVPGSARILKHSGMEAFVVAKLRPVPPMECDPPGTNYIRF